MKKIKEFLAFDNPSPIPYLILGGLFGLALFLLFFSSIASAFYIPSEMGTGLSGEHDVLCYEKNTTSYLGVDYIYSPSVIHAEPEAFGDFYFNSATDHIAPKDGSPYYEIFDATGEKISAYYSSTKTNHDSTPVNWSISPDYRFGYAVTDSTTASGIHRWFVFNQDGTHLYNNGGPIALVNDEVAFGNWVSLGSSADPWVYVCMYGSSTVWDMHDLNPSSLYLLDKDRTTSVYETYTTNFYSSVVDYDALTLGMLTDLGAECGNDIIEGEEECDDGNLIDGDGCQSSCLWASCGDEILDQNVFVDGVQYFEFCEPSTYGCSSGCGWLTSVCGNGMREASEQCDDGNTSSGDGCDNLCNFEDSLCGDGVRQVEEECDDGNVVSGDGCSAGCSFEASQSDEYGASQNMKLSDYLGFNPVNFSLINDTLNPREEVTEGDTVTTGHELSYSFQVTDPLNRLESLAIYLKSDCFSSGVVQWEDLDVNKGMNVETGSGYSVDAYGNGTFKAENFEYYMTTTDVPCDVAFYTSFKSLDGQVYNHYETTVEYVSAPEERETRLGIFDQKIDFSEFTVFENLSEDGKENLNRIIAPFFNGMFSALGNMFNEVYSRIPFLMDMSSMLIPADGTAIVYPSSFFGKSMSSSYTTSLPSSVSWEESDFKDWVEIVLKVIIFVSLLGFFFSLLFGKKPQSTE